MERFPSKQSNESIDGSTLSDMKITESQTLPRRTVSSEAVRYLKKYYIFTYML